MKKRYLAAISLSLVLLALAMGWCVYVGDYYAADGPAITAMEGNQIVSVEKTETIAVFTPENPTAGFLFYPGGKVEAAAYAPLMLALAQRDVLCVLISMPCNLAVLNPNAAEGIAQRFPEIERWYIGGHSLGGSMAASYAARHREELWGLVLLASYAATDLSASGLEVLSVYGSEDGVLNMEKYESNRVNLPEAALEIIIPGGNHAGFGSYGPQTGDGAANISSDEQIRFTAEKIAEFMSAA